ncbi:unnamed protein product [Caenorhabditis angaria]|uniref:Ubiquitin-like domain-containing protein n=1 Tax=Caenorhabditis angaria TaxID=860376 RepID=A0A9P1J5N3_9PELO|nr:unnamed protein product [Caenorhabditis angaria]
MQFLVVLKDHIDVTHKQYEMEFTTETTMAQMKDEIASLFDVPSQYQRLFHENGNPIGRADLNGPISQMGLHHMDVLVVTHGQLEMWITYTDLVRDFANCQYSASKQTIAETAMDHFNSMSKGKLFSGYSAFYKEFSKLHAPISKYLDKQTKWIKAAACSYFKLSMFRGQNPKLKFEPTFDGSRSAVVCIVNLESAERKFRIKTNHDAKVSSTAASFNINLIEMFLYKLFESINIGSKITFIPNCVLSKSIIYIASEWIPNLKTINDIHEDDLGNLTEEIVQLHFLAVFLTLGDLHEENFGFFEKKIENPRLYVL